MGIGAKIKKAVFKPTRTKKQRATRRKERTGKKKSLKSQFAKGVLPGKKPRSAAELAGTAVGRVIGTNPKKKKKPKKSKRVKRKRGPTRRRRTQPKQQFEVRL